MVIGSLSIRFATGPPRFAVIRPQIAQTTRELAAVVDEQILGRSSLRNETIQNGRRMLAR
jgi:hypothetical protein